MLQRDRGGWRGRLGCAFINSSSLGMTPTYRPLSAVARRGPPDVFAGSSSFTPSTATS